MGMGGEGIGKGECLIRNGLETGGNKVVSVKHRFYRPTFSAAHNSPLQITNHQFPVTPSPPPSLSIPPNFAIIAP